MRQKKHLGGIDCMSLATTTIQFCRSKQYGWCEYVTYLYIARKRWIFPQPQLVNLVAQTRLYKALTSVTVATNSFPRPKIWPSANYCERLRTVQDTGTTCSKHHPTQNPAVEREACARPSEKDLGGGRSLTPPHMFPF